MLPMMHTDDFHNTWIPCYFSPTRTKQRKRERGSHMYVASNFSWCQSHLFNQWFGILWPLTPRLSHSTCATARRVTSLSCQLHSALLQWLWCLGVWPHRAPDCSPGRVLEKVGEATCHCPTAMEESGGPGAQHDCWKYNTWCCQRPFQLGGERKRKQDEMTARLRRVTMLAPSKWKTVPMETAKSLRTNFPSAKPGASNYMKWLDNQSVSNTPKTP